MQERISFGAVEQLRLKLAEKPKVALICHLNPDGDAIGSLLSFGIFLKKLDLDVSMVVPNKPAEFLHWMPGSDQLIDHESDTIRAETAIGDADMLVCLDFNAPSRVGNVEKALLAHPFKVMVDHHEEPTNDWQIPFSEPKRSSTCELVYDIIEALEQMDLIDLTIATNMYTGIVTDTGSFRYSATTDRTHEIAAALLRKGVNPARVQENILNSSSEDRMRLWGLALLERLELHHDGQLAIIALTLKDLHRFHYRPGDTEGLVNQGLSVKGVRMSVFIAEQDGYVKMSSRSVGDLPVNGFMRDNFNGGGHMNAAGGRSFDSLQDTLRKVRDRSFDLLQDNA